MRNRDQFGPNPFDSYRGREWELGTRSSSYLYGAPSPHRDFSSHTYHTSDYSMGPHGHGDADNLANRNTYPNAPVGRHRYHDRSSYGSPASRGTSGYSGYGGYSSEPTRQGSSDRDFSDYRTDRDDWRSRDSWDRERSTDRYERDSYNRNPSRDTRSDYNRGWSSAPNPERYGHPRDWSERASDEVRSWFGDDEAERRRERDERYERDWW